MIGHLSPISGIAATDKLVATAGYDNRVILWDRSTRTPLVVGNHDHLANQCRFDDTGRFLVTSSSDFTTRVWTVPDLSLHSVLTSHRDDVEMSVISPDGSRVATASRDYKVRVFDLSGALQHEMSGHKADVLSAEWTGDGTGLITSSDDGTVRRWDASTGQLLATVDLGDIETDTIAVMEPSTIFAGNDEGQIVVIDPAGVRKVSAHQAGIKRVIFDARRRLLVTSSYDRTIQLWSVLPSGELSRLRSASVPAVVWLRSCAFAGEDDVVFGTFGSSYASYSIARDEWDLEGVHDTNGVNAVACVDGSVLTVGDAGIVRRDGEQLARPGSCCNFLTDYQGMIVTGGQLGSVFDGQTGRLLYQHRSPLNCGQVIGEEPNARLVVGTYTGEGLVFERTGEGDLRLVAEIRLHDNAIKGMAANATYLFSVSATGAAAFHRVPDLTLESYLPDAHEMIADGASVLPDGRFVSVSRDRKLRIFEDCAHWTAVDTPHENSHKAVSVDPRTGLVATTGYRGRVAVLDPGSGAWTYNRRLTMSGISSITPGRLAGTFLAASYDGKVYEVAMDSEVN